MEVKIVFHSILEISQFTLFWHLSYFIPKFLFHTTDHAFLCGKIKNHFVTISLATTITKATICISKVNNLVCVVYFDTLYFHSQLAHQASNTENNLPKAILACLGQEIISHSIKGFCLTQLDAKPIDNGTFQWDVTKYKPSTFFRILCDSCMSTCALSLLSCMH